MLPLRLTLCAAGSGAFFLVSLQLPAQQADSARKWSATAGAQAVGVLTHVRPALRGRSLTEGYLTQPLVMAHAASPGRLLGLSLAVDFEGLTLKRGELNPGVYGEGYFDRRHPHTYLHEAIVSVGHSSSGRAYSLSGGKGFVPFGTDDPMVRPFVKYPANHHLAQVLERSMIAGALRWQNLIVEAALFGGDEPTGPGDSPQWDRFGDSWAARATLVRQRMEVQASFASVVSPEIEPGGGLDQHKSSVSVRFGAGRWSSPYALVEWARTDERSGGRNFGYFTSALAEGSLVRRSTKFAARLERTTRPEEERLLDVYRTPNPHSDIATIGQTRWHIATLAVSRQQFVGRITTEPFVEATVAGISSLPGSAFDPAREVFGSRTVWSLSAGLRLAAGTLHRRMGRYGAALPDDPAAGHRHH